MPKIAAMDMRLAYSVAIVEGETYNPVVVCFGISVCELYARKITDSLDLCLVEQKISYISAPRSWFD